MAESPQRTSSEEVGATSERSDVARSTNDDEHVPSTRPCGRCRRTFPAPADIHPSELAGWWACPACSAAIIPHHRDTDAERSAAGALRSEAAELGRTGVPAETRATR